jgi:3-isopropylmalate/(R)-2-methylmalate dehydratase small subunit
MKPFIKHKGIAAPLLRSNIDTDAIIPSVEMTGVTKKGLSDGLFSRWRYQDRAARLPNPDFILNQTPFTQASLILAGENFGCGSSREHAVWALAEFGIRAIIAPSFGSIFRTNCITNGLLPISLEWPLVKEIAQEVGRPESENELEVDLGSRSISTPGGRRYEFQILDSESDMLINGWDPILLTLQAEGKIRQFESRDQNQRPWVYLPDPK